MKRLKILTLLISATFLLGMAVGTTGCLEEFPDGEEPTTGAIKVMYDARPGEERDVVIYLENESDQKRLGQIPSDEWRTFKDIEPGDYKIFAENLDGLLLDSKGITIYRDKTKTVELSW
ncbi:MAG: hypothetical protein V5A66_03070 [Candidatus Thermoplasmatota archaeon]